MIAEASARLTTRDGVALEALLAVPASSRAGVIVCHPHPLYGGDMDNPVVVRLVEVLGGLGWATLRFNFRGTGGSTGTHGDGLAERGDVEAARAHLTALVGEAMPMVLAGYSFGAAVVAQVAAGHPELGGVVLVAPPLSRVDAAGFAGLAAFGDRLLIVAGSNDEICPASELARLQAATPGASTRVLPGANHFFFGTLYPLGEAVADWARRAGLA